MNGIVLISDHKVQTISIKDNGDELVDLKKYPGFIFSDKHSGINPGFSFVRKTVAEKLLQAQKMLPSEIKIIFEEGHRPVAVQKKIFEDYFKQLQQKFSDLNEEELKQECYKYVADPHGTPPHSTGGAIDISLADLEGNELDMGSDSDETPDINGDRNFTYSKNISGQAVQNRELLIKIMNALGFVNYPSEWWHWSFGDQYWAFAKKEPSAIYGTIKNPSFVPNLSISYWHNKK